MQKSVGPIEAIAQDSATAITALVVAIPIRQLAAKMQFDEAKSTKTKIQVALDVEDETLVLIHRIDRPHREAFEQHYGGIGQIKVGIERSDPLVANDVVADVEGQVAARAIGRAILNALDRGIEIAAGLGIADARLDLPAAQVELQLGIELQIFVRLIHIFAVVANTRTIDRARNKPSILDHGARHIKVGDLAADIIAQAPFGHLIVELGI